MNELFAALAKAQAMITSAPKDANNPFFKSQYTTLDACWTVARIPLSSNGLCVIQTIKQENEKIYLTTILGHASGQFISSTLPLLLVKTDPQSLGSMIQYMKRYSFCAIVGISSGDIDDDGEKAMGAHRAETKAKGGHARAEALSPEERSQIASKAAIARWQGEEPAQAKWVNEEEFSDEDFYTKIYPYLPKCDDPSFGLTSGMRDYLNSLVTDKLSSNTIMKQALRSNDMTKRFCNSWLVWHELKNA